ncbi:MAG: HAD family phosphatase [Firmicutes bacterium]|nr:HAD family phosphatase [Bacillota bacterium]
MKAVIFDLDGTLIDSMGVWEQIACNFLKDRGIPIPEGIGYKLKNMSFQESAEYYIKTFALSETREELIETWNKLAYREYAENINLKDGAFDYLTHLAKTGIKMGIATATCRRLAEAVLRRHGILSLFQVIVTLGEFAHGRGMSKGEPFIFLQAAQKLGVSPSECIVIEDSLHAVQGAIKAGMKVWAIYDRFSECEKPQLEALAGRYLLGFHELLEEESQ